jgi:hypothetical protein
MGEMRNIYGILFRDPDEKRSFGRAMRRIEGSFKMDLKIIRMGGCRRDSSGSD